MLGCPTARAARSPASSGRRSRDIAPARDRRCARPSARSSRSARGVSIATRGLAAITASRVKPAAAGTAVARRLRGACRRGAGGCGAPALGLRAVALARPGLRRSPAPAAAAAAPPAPAACRCFSICGMPKKYCQASSTSAGQDDGENGIFLVGHLSVLDCRWRAIVAQPRSVRRARQKSCDQPVERRCRGRRAVRSARSHGPVACATSRDAVARPPAGAGAPGCARPHCRPSSRP